VFNALDFGDLIPATIKVSFGFAIGLVGCFKGYYCKKRNCRVGVAANSAVVYTPFSLLLILSLFLLLIYFMIYN
jgi:phospholipid/cholesterol/gamma-HCH transport system permease protein